MTSLPTPAARRDTALHAVPNGAPVSTDRELGHAWHQLVAANASANHPHRFDPSPTQVDILRALAARGGDSWATQLAQDTGRHQSNVSRWTLPGLVSIGVIDYGEEVRHARGGMPARHVHLTAAGRRIVELLPALDVDNRAA